MGKASHPRGKRCGRFRSGFEFDVASQLINAGIEVRYEDTVLRYTVPERVCRYTPDFVLPNGIFIEAKGRWDSQDRLKHKLLRTQSPELDIRIVFQNARLPIRKGSPTTYGDYCTKIGIKWAQKTIPPEWLI